jgi:hypothetical protein
MSLSVEKHLILINKSSVLHKIGNTPFRVGVTFKRNKVKIQSETYQLRFRITVFNLYLEFEDGF